MATLTHPKSFSSKIFAQPERNNRLFHDGVFTHEKWHRHRNTAWRHRPEPVTWFTVLLGFGWHMLYVLAITALVGLYETFLVPTGVTSIAVAGMQTPFSLMTFALSLLLVFKTNSSYARWVEGRVIWGAIVNYMRNLTRQALCHLPPEEQHLKVSEQGYNIVNCSFVIERQFSR